MKVFNINLGIGESSSGVEYAQSYRSKILNELENIEPYFVFLDWMPKKSVYNLSENIGLCQSQVRWFYDVLRSERVSENGITKDFLEQTYGQKGSFSPNGNFKLEINENAYIIAYQHDCKQGEFRKIEFVSNNRLFFSNYFSKNKIYATELYRINPKTQYSACYRRLIFDGSQQLVLTENVHGQDNSSFIFEEKFYPSKELLFKEFMLKIGVDSKSSVLVDRSTGTAKTLINLKKQLDFNLSIVVHADHYVLENTDENGIDWNNYYDYVFRNADKIDFFICSTKAQSMLLRKQLNKYLNHSPQVKTIPVGFLEKLKDVPLQKRDETKFITVSRLASEKNLEVAIKAFAIAKDISQKDLSLDIYGDGPEKEKLEKLVKELGLVKTISFKGHHKMDEIYQKYSVYLSASATEGFGLSLMEAIGSGLFMIGFNVPYGNPTFMNTEGGFLADGHPKDEESIEKLAEQILNYLNLKNKVSIRSRQYSLAKEFLFKKNLERWKEFFCDVIATR